MCTTTSSSEFLTVYVNSHDLEAKALCLEGLEITVPGACLAGTMVKGRRSTTGPHRQRVRDLCQAGREALPRKWAHTCQPHTQSSALRQHPALGLVTLIADTPQRDAGPRAVMNEDKWQDSQARPYHQTRRLEDFLGISVSCHRA